MSSNESKSNDSGEIFSLTGLRFVAAFYVFLFHMNIRWPLSENSFINNILNQGYIGMSVFFILSGFVLAYRYADGSATTKDYLINRFARIYPIYALCAIITLPWIGVHFDPSSLTTMIKSIGQAALLIFSNIFLIQAWFPQFLFNWNDIGSWSISVEAFCYLLIPFVLPKFSKFSIKLLFLTAAICYLLAVLPGLSLKVFGKSPLMFAFYSLPFYRFPEFLLGVCIYFATRFKSTYLLGTKFQLSLLSVLLLYLAFVGITWPDLSSSWITLPIISFIIFSLSYNVGLINSLLSSKIFVWLGKISYCFYSFQILILLFLLQYHTKLINIIPLLGNGKILALAAFIVILLLSVLGYYFVEEPARHRIKRYHKKKMGINSILPRSMRP